MSDIASLRATYEAACKADDAARIEAKCATADMLRAVSAAMAARKTAIEACAALREALQNQI